MSLANEFNALNGMIVTRKDLEKLLEKAEKERHTVISKRVIKVLEGFADDTFLIEIRNLVEPYGLNGVDTDDITGLLGGLEFVSHNEDVGLGNPVSPQDIYDMVTQRMIDLIKNANKGDYKRAWKEEGYLIPYNFITKKAYRGINVIMLSPLFGLLDNPYFLTFNQIQEKGGKLRKGSHGHKVVYYSTFNKEYSDTEIEKINNVTKGEKLEKGDEKTIFFLKYYNVFNGSDIEGIDFDLDNFSLQGKVANEVEAGENETIAIAESIVANYPNPRPEIFFLGNGASYSPDVDTVRMPDISKFKTSQDFYRTLFHELSHSTGHESRLKRPFKNAFGTPEYAFEELIAEFGAVFLSAQAGIMYYTNKNHAGYLKGWNEVLLPNLENDNRFLMRASSQAQKASDFILQPDAKGNFLFLKKELKKEIIKTVKKETQLSLFDGLNGIKASSEIFRKMTVSELRKFTLEYYNQYLKGKKIAIKNHLKEVVFVAGAGRKMLQPIYSEKVAVMEHLEELIKNSTYNNWGERKEKDSSDVLGYLNFKSKITIDGQKRHVRISVIFDRDRKTKLKTFEVGGNKKSGDLPKVAVASPKDGDKKPLSKDKDTKKGLNAPIVHTKIVATEKIRSTPNHSPKENLDKNSLAYKMANKPKDVPIFKIENSDIAEFLGNIERKTKESVVISLTGGQGSMKTRMCFQFMNALAQNYKVGHASIEEHPESGVYYDKAEQYLNAKALQNIEAPEIKTIPELENLIKKNDVIVIDSFTKMQEMEKGFEVDKDLRKKYDGKLFIVIFQQTTDGKMRGGSKSQFDADIVLFTEKKDNYEENYIYADKNRYQNKPLDGLKFNIFNKKLIQDKTEEVAEPTTKKKLSFKVNYDE